MNHIFNYKARMAAYGNTLKEVYTNTTIRAINDNFSNATTFQNIIVDSLPTDVRVLDGKISFQGNQILSFAKELWFRPNTIRRRGSYAILDGEHWLLFDFVTGIVPKASIRRCNATISVQSEHTVSQVGTDSMGRPVNESQIITSIHHCVIETKVQSPDGALNAAINLPQEQVLITLPYRDNIKRDTTLTLWGQEYKVVGINLQFVIGGEGVMILTAQNKVRD